MSLIKSRMPYVAAILVLYFMLSCDSEKPVLDADSTATINAVAHQLPVVCESKEETNPQSTEDPILIDMCLWDGYFSRTTSYPDRYGRYSYSEYQLGIIDNGEMRIVNNDEFFNQNVTILESLINTEMRNQFDLNSKDPENSECLQNQTMKNYTINNVGIRFIETNEIEFSISLGLGMHCLPIDQISATFPLSEIKKFIK
jgi:hypothetical protein